MEGWPWGVSWEAKEDEKHDDYLTSPYGAIDLCSSGVKVVWFFSSSFFSEEVEGDFAFFWDLVVAACFGYRCVDHIDHYCIVGCRRKAADHTADHTADHRTADHSYCRTVDHHIADHHTHYHAGIHA